MRTNMKRAFGYWLRHQRQAAGWAEQQDVASVLKVSPAAVSFWENGVNVPRWRVAEQLADLYGVDRAEMERRRVLAGGQPAPSEPDPETLIPWDRWCEAGSVLVLAGSWHDPDPEPGGETP